MTFSFAIPDESLPAWIHRLNQFNAGSGDAPITLEQFIQARADDTNAKYTETLANYQRAQLAADDTMAEISARLLGMSEEARSAKLLEIHALFDS